MYKTNTLKNSRLIDRIPSVDNTTSNKRRKMMQTSTPRSMSGYRDKIPDEISPSSTSPISNKSEESDNNELVVSPTQVKCTNISDPLDLTKLTPDKPVSISTEEKRLAKGARDLGAGNRSAMSLPDLSWENIENSFFNKCPTRKRENIIRPEPRVYSMSGLEDIDCSQWSNEDFNEDFKTRSGVSDNIDMGIGEQDVINMTVEPNNIVIEQAQTVGTASKKNHTEWNKVNVADSGVTNGEADSNSITVGVEQEYE